MDNIDQRRLKVNEFHRFFDVKRRRAFIDCSTGDAVAREWLLKEELKEFETAKNNIELFDAVLDIEYIIAGTQDVMHIERSHGAKVTSLVQGVAWILAELAKSRLCQRGLMDSTSATRSWLDAHVLRLQEGFDRVHATNMNKTWSPKDIVLSPIDLRTAEIIHRTPTQSIVKRKPDGKILKPPGWVPPKLDDLVSGEIFV